LPHPARGYERRTGWGMGRAWVRSRGRLLTDAVAETGMEKAKSLREFYDELLEARAQWRELAIAGDQEAVAWLVETEMFVVYVRHMHPDWPEEVWPQGDRPVSGEPTDSA